LSAAITVPAEILVDMEMRQYVPVYMIVSILLAPTKAPNDTHES